MRFFAGSRFAAACLAAAVFAASAAGQEKPKVAVYVTADGKVGLIEKAVMTAAAPVVGGALAKALGVTGKSEGVDLTKDITKAYGASVGPGQAAEIGRQFGVQGLSIVKISNINAPAKSFMLKVDLVEVSTGRVTATGGPANVVLSDPVGIAKAMGEIALGLVKGLAANAAVKAVTGNTGGGTPVAAAPPTPTPAPVAVAAPTQEAAPVSYAAPADAAMPAAQPEPAAPAPVRKVSPALPIGERPYIAVYTRGRAKDDEIKTAFGTEMLFALAKSERYRAIESNVEFVASVNRETEKLGVGNLTDKQIAYIAGVSGAAYVCVVDVATVLNSYQILARVVDAKTLDAAEMGKAIGRISVAEDITTVADKVVESMLGTGGSAASPAIQQYMLEMREWAQSVEKQQVGRTQTQIQELQQQVESLRQAQPVGGRLEGAASTDDGEEWLKSTNSVAFGIGYYINIDGDGGLYLQVDPNRYLETRLDISFMDEGVNISALGKLPFGSEVIKIFPLSGFEYSGYISNLSWVIGLGVSWGEDAIMGHRFFVRYDFLWHVGFGERRIKSSEYYYYDDYNYYGRKNFMTMHMGIGYKLGGKR